MSVLRLGLTVSEIRSHQKPDHETVLLYRTVFYSGIHYQKGAKAKNAQIREKERAATGEGVYGEDAGEERAEEGEGRGRKKEEKAAQEQWRCCSIFS